MNNFRNQKSLKSFTCLDRWPPRRSLLLDASLDYFRFQLLRQQNCIHCSSSYRRILRHSKHRQRLNVWNLGIHTFLMNWACTWRLMLPQFCPSPSDSLDFLHHTAELTGRVQTLAAAQLPSLKVTFVCPQDTPKEHSILLHVHVHVYIYTHYIYIHIIYIYTHYIYISYTYIIIVMVWSDTRQYQPIQYYTRWYTFWIQYNTR